MSVITVAAIQQNSQLGDTDFNLKQAGDLVSQAASQGAKWIALPEFFNTGVAWDPSLVDKIENEEGPSPAFLKRLSADLDIVLGGSLMFRSHHGSVYNRYFLFSSGALIGTHDKDHPTMWENYFYEPGKSEDEGVLGNVDDINIGSAMCWEFLRSGTSKRLRGKVDIVMGGTHWWSIPTNWPRWVQNMAEPYNHFNAMETVIETAKLIGAPVLNACHCNELRGNLPAALIRYRGYCEGQTSIIDAKGKVLAKREREQGEGFVVAEVNAKAVPVTDAIPSSFWLREPGFIPRVAWHYQRFLGKRWYRKHVLK